MGATERAIGILVLRDWTSVVFGVPQGSALGLLFAMYTSDMFDLIENMVFACADDYTLVAGYFTCC